MNGVLIINKPKAYTSHDVVNVIRKRLNIKKVGHTGTLDPNATGVLPILVGNATKISKYLIEHNKTYIATLKLGEKTDTGDSEGKVIEQIQTDFYSNIQIERVLKSFLGDQTQLPPKYSAIKINGKKMYEYARDGQAIEVLPRNIEIFDINLIKNSNNVIEFKVKCSKGTYIRVLCEDIAKKLGTIGYMKELQRTKVDKFAIEDAIELEDLTEELANKNIIKIENIFKENKKIELDDRKLELFLNGVKLTYNMEDGLYKIYNKNNFIGLGIIKKQLLKRDVI